MPQNTIIIAQSLAKNIYYYYYDYYFWNITYKFKYYLLSLIGCRYGSGGYYSNFDIVIRSYIYYDDFIIIKIYAMGNMLVFKSWKL